MVSLYVKTHCRKIVSMLSIRHTSLQGCRAAANTTRSYDAQLFFVSNTLARPTLTLALAQNAISKPSPRCAN